ncbi:phosphatidylserine decarboxylase family protein [bacterium SCSIO 12741]|nr:phosphatidylserine decarboxylase family protein [bacterium SCSIO 12741]
MHLHKEGTKIMLSTLLGLTALNFLVYYAFGLSIGLWIALGISFIIQLAVTQFFRVPHRKVVLDENHIISPADGKVVVIEEVFEDEYFQEKRIQVSIFMSPLNVHVNWAPISGIVKYAKYHAGKFLVAWHPKSSTENERTTVVYENSKLSVLVRQIAGAVARRIIYYPREGDQYKQAQQMGFIKFGSRVDLLLPLDVDIQVEIDQKVTGLKTIIAKIPE